MRPVHATCPRQEPPKVKEPTPGISASAIPSAPKVSEEWIQQAIKDMASGQTETAMVKALIAIYYQKV